MLFSDQDSGTSYIGTSNSEISWDWSHETWSHEASWEFSSREVILEKIPISLKVMRRDWDTALLIWSVGVILIILVVRTKFLPLLALPDNVLYLMLLNSASCCCRCLIFWSCSSITSAYDGSMLTFLNGLSAGYNDPVDVDECVFVSESFVRFIWFMLSGVAMFYVFQKKWGSLWSFVCWFSQIINVLIQLNYEGVVIFSWESDLCANDMTQFKCFCLV